jgi:PAS domain S-box-containing protein
MQDNEESRDVDEGNELRQQIARLQKLLNIQHQVAFAAGLFQGDVTVRTLMESLAESLIVVDLEGKIILINKRTEEIFGYTKEEVVGQSLDILLPEKFIQVHSQHVQTYLREPHIRPMGQGLELSARRKDGTEFPVEIGLSFLDTEPGRWGLAFVTDITLRKQAEHALKKRNEDLDAALM